MPCIPLTETSSYHIKIPKGQESVKLATNNFTGFDFQTCWDACQGLHPTTIAVDGPAERSMDQAQCVFPFTHDVKRTKTKEGWKVPAVLLYLLRECTCIYTLVR